MTQQMPFVVQNVTKISHNYTLRVKKIIKNDPFFVSLLLEILFGQLVDRQTTPE